MFKEIHDFKIGAVLVDGDRSMVEAALSKFPMIARGLLKCEVIALKPYVGLASLFAQP